MDWPGIVSSPAVVDGKLYIGSDDENFYCLDANNGQKIWDYPLPGGTSVASPAVYDGKVYVGSVYYNFYCWDAETGNLIWKISKKYGKPSHTIAVDEKIYVNFIDDDGAKLFCLNASTGIEIWNYTGETSSPAVYDGKIYFGKGKNIYCLNADNGIKIWNYTTNIKTAGNFPVLFDGKIYIGTRDPPSPVGNFYCLNASNGEMIWKVNAPGSHSAVAGYGNIYYTSLTTGTLYCLKADNGDEIWNYTLGGDNDWGVCTPAIADGKIYIGVRTNGKLLCIDAYNGELIWDYQVGVPDWLFNSPAIAYDRLYIGTCQNNYIYCFGLVDTSSNPPDIPTIDGPTSGVTDTIYNYTFITNDPDGDDVFYEIKWGDTKKSSKGPCIPGVNVTVSHIWVMSGDYNITARAWDKNLKVSEWSEPFNVDITPGPPFIPEEPQPPDGATDIDVNNDLYWKCGNRDPMTFDVYFEAGDPNPDVLVSENQTSFSYDPGHMNHSTQYYWKVIAWNVLGESASGPVWSFTTEDNAPPYPPDNPIPWDGATNVDIYAILSWDGSDPDDDYLTYDVYFGESITPPKVASNISNTSYNPGPMDINTNYFWKIVTWDYMGMSAPGNIWSFTTGSEPNNPPYIPNNPNPEDDANNIGVNVNLSWTGGDPDEGDTVYYNVYLEPNNPNPKVKVANLITETWFNIGVLDYNKVYYWKVIAYDNHGRKSNGPIWSFTTEKEPNEPPKAPIIDGPSSGKTGNSYDFIFNSVDTDDDYVRYHIDWGDNTTDLTDFNSSGTDVFISHLWDLEGVYTITAFAEDEHGLISSESIKVVTMPRNKAISNLLMKLLDNHPLLNYLFQRLILM